MFQVFGPLYEVVSTPDSGLNIFGKAGFLLVINQQKGMENQQNSQQGPVQDQGTIQEGGTFQTDTYSDAYGQNQSDPTPGSGREYFGQNMENEDLPPLSEADTASMYTDLGMGNEDPYNHGDDEAMDTILHTDTHTAINTTESRSNALAYEDEADDLTMEIDLDDEIEALDRQDSPDEDADLR